MDVASNIQLQTSEGNDELADADESEPDLIIRKDNKDQKIKGRFTIEEIEEHILEDRCKFEDKLRKNIFYSFQRNKLNFFQREILDEEKDVLCKENLSGVCGFVFDYNSQCYFRAEDLYSLKETDDIDLNSLYCKNKYGDLFSKEIESYDLIKLKNKSLVNFPDDISNNDYAMIIHEETLENETCNNQSPDKLLHTISEDKVEDNKCSLKANYFRSNKAAMNSRKNSVCTTKKYSSFDQKFNENFVSPPCSPINIPRLPITASVPKTNLYLKSRKDKFRMMREYIKNVEDSFELEDKNSNMLYQLRRGTQLREKRIYSAEIRSDALERIKSQVNAKQEVQKQEENFSRAENFIILCSPKKSEKSCNYTNLIIEHTNTFLISKYMIENPVSSSKKLTKTFCKNCGLEGKNV